MYYTILATGQLTSFSFNLLNIIKPMIRKAALLFAVERDGQEGSCY
jgi:hypothetical protein